MKNKFNPHLKQNQNLQDWGGNFVVVFLGTCPLCGCNCFGRKDENEKHISDPDPRGIIGPNYAASHFVASEYNFKGRDVLFCYHCKSDNAISYKKALEYSKQVWSANK